MPEKPKPIILLSGPVGAGKTTIAPELVAISPGPLVNIEGDTFWAFMAKSGEEFSGKKQFRVIMASMVAAAMPYALAGCEVIVDFSIPPWFLPTVLKLADRRKVPVDFVVLRPSLSTCAERAASRAEGTITDYSSYVEFYSDFDEALERCVVVGDGATPSELASTIRADLDAGKFRISG